MNAQPHVAEDLVLAVLSRLWRAGEDAQAEAAPADSPLPMQELLRDTHAELADIQAALNALEQRGCVIQRTPAGLQLLSAGLGCWRDVLEDGARRKARRVGRRAQVYAATTSTNDVAWQCAADPDADGLVIVADEQTAGRGRLGHRWLTAPGQSVLLSVLLTGMPAAFIDPLTLLAGLAAAVALEKILARAGHPQRLEIKWPNDLLLQGRKIAGILVERRPMPGDPAVIGIGINVCQQPADFPAAIAHRAASLCMAGARPDRLRVTAAVLESLEHYRSRLAADSAWLEEWKSRCAMLGRPIAIRTGGAAGPVVRGQVLDVAPLQGLVVRDDRGATHFLSARTSTVV
jgi:BirA family transcriptional regulator, biotin operon repressor / biotin---[acetyl-CoA-carboxylase] ligase